MRTIDLLAIHWTGGVGMFTALAGHPFVGGLICGIAQVIYSALSRTRS